MFSCMKIYRFTESWRYIYDFDTFLPYCRNNTTLILLLFSTIIKYHDGMKDIPTTIIIILQRSIHCFCSYLVMRNNVGVSFAISSVIVTNVVGKQHTWGTRLFPSTDYVLLRGPLFSDCWLFCSSIAPTCQIHFVKAHQVETICKYFKYCNYALTISPLNI